MCQVFCLFYLIEFSQHTSENNYFHLTKILRDVSDMIKLVTVNFLTFLSQHIPVLLESLE